MRRAIAAIVVACVAALAPLVAFGQSSPAVTTPFSFTSQNQSITIPLNGQAWCSVAVAATSGTLVPSVSTDNSVFQVVANIGAGSITIANTYSGPATGNGLNFFRLQQTTTGASSGTITCTSSVAGQPSGQNSNGSALTYICDQSVPVNIVTATTTQLVAAVPGSTIYPCSFAVTVVGTAPTILFEGGTGGTCGTNTTVLSGTYLPVATSTFELGGNTGIFVKVPLSVGFCAVTGGTLPGVQGILTYAIIK